MKSSLRTVLQVQALVIAAVTGLIACGSFKDQKSSNSYQIPWQNADSTYSLQNVQVSSLTDPDHLSGTDVRVLVTPGASGSKIDAPTPTGHYVVTKQGTKIPRDTVTMEAVTLSAHIERLRALAAGAGVDDTISWPMTVGIETVSTDSSGFINNACFDGNFNALLTSVFTQKKNLPLAMNGGVIAHEFFHMIFDKVVIRKLGGTSGQTGITSTNATTTPVTATANAVNDFLIRGMNEGLADFWGWLYSGDDNFIKASLPQVDTERSLDAAIRPLQDTADMNQCLQLASWTAAPSEGNQIYYIGTRYARFLRALTLKQFGQDDRQQMAKLLMDSLKSFADSASVQVASAADLSPNDVLFAVFDHLPTVDDETCNLYDQVAAGASDAELANRPAKCLAFPRHTDASVARAKAVSNHGSCGS